MKDRPHGRKRRIFSWSLVAPSTYPSPACESSLDRPCSRRGRAASAGVRILVPIRDGDDERQAPVAPNDLEGGAWSAAAPRAKTAGAQPAMLQAKSAAVAQPASWQRRGGECRTQMRSQ